MYLSSPSGTEPGSKRMAYHLSQRLGRRYGLMHPSAHSSAVQHTISLDSFVHVPDKPQSQSSDAELLVVPDEKEIPGIKRLRFG